MLAIPSTLKVAALLALISLSGSLVQAQGATSRMPLSDCTIIKDPAPIPKVGIVCGNPARPPIICEQHFDAGSCQLHTDFRGFQVYNGTYKGMEMFVANTGLGGPACAFLVEELIAHGADVIVRLGTNDYNVTEADVQNVYVLESVRGNWGIPRDYGIASESWGGAVYSDPDLFKALYLQAQKTVNVTAVRSSGYTIDAFYAFLDPTHVAASEPTVQAMIDDYQTQGCNVRDMESGALLTLGKLRGVKTASVLQAVVKSGSNHAPPGITGIPVVLETLYNFKY